MEITDGRIGSIPGADRLRRLPATLRHSTRKDRPLEADARTCSGRCLVAAHRRAQVDASFQCAGLQRSPAFRERPVVRADTKVLTYTKCN